MGVDCQHEKIEKQVVEKKFAGESFTHDAAVCTICGAFLRDKDYEVAFLDWVEGVYKRDRSKFQVQCHLNVGLLSVAEKFLGEYPGVTHAHLFRGLVVIYLNHIDSDARLAEQFAALLDASVLDSFTRKCQKKRVNIQFKPKMLLELEAMADVIKCRPAQLVESSVVKMMSAITSQNAPLKALCEREIMKYLAPILKAA